MIALGPAEALDLLFGFPEAPDWRSRFQRWEALHYANVRLIIYEDLRAVPLAVPA